MAHPGGSGEERRAKEVVRTAVPFAPRAGLGAHRLARRAIDRWAPEGGRLRGGLGALSFVDSRLMPYFHRAELLSAGAGLGLSLTAPANERSSLGRGRQAPVANGNWVFPEPWYLDELDWQAAGDGGRRADPMSNLIHAYSPAVPFAAAQAATMMQAARLAPVVERSVTPAPFEFVAPSRLAEVLDLEVVDQDGELAPSAVVPTAYQGSTAPPSVERAPRALPAAGPRVSLVPGLSGLVAAVQAQVAATTPFGGAVAPVGGAVAPFGGAVAPFGGAVAPFGGAVAPFGGAVAPLGGAVAPFGGAVAPRPSPRTAAVEQRTVAPGEPGPTRRAPDPVFAWTRPAPTISATSPAALRHLGWADRWLAHFAGAGPGSLASFSPTLSGLGGGSLVREAPPTRDYVAPADAGVAPAGDLAVVTAPVAPELPAAPIVDEGEPVSDDEFAAIAQAASTTRRGPAPKADGRQRHRLAMAPVRHRPAPVERWLARAALMATAGAGLAAGLDASPVSPALASITGLTPRQPFDVRRMVAPSLDYYAPAEPGTAAIAEVASLGGVAPPRPPGGMVKPSARRLGRALPLPIPTRIGGEPAARVRDSHDLPLTLSEGESSAGLSPQSARPGSVGRRAQGFAFGRQLAANDLVLDFAVPELIVAARRYGLGPRAAVQAARWSAAGPSQLSWMARDLDAALVSAAIGPRTGLPTGGGTGTLLPVSLRTPRGAFLLPETSARELGVRPDKADRTDRAALDLVAARNVYADVTAPARAPVSSDPAIASALTRGLSPSVQAARALASVQVEAPGQPTETSPARAAWASLPSLAWVTGAESTAEHGQPSQSRPTATSAPVYVSSRRAGRELGRLVAPSASVATPTAAQASQRSPAQQVIRQGGAPDGAGDVERFRGSKPSYASGADLPAWFEDAARKLLVGGADGRGISLAEMTLVQAAPAKHVSPSLRSASGPTPQLPTAAAEAGQIPAADIDELAQEVYEEVVRLIALVRERNGDPWRQT